MTVDKKCWELAEHFLADLKGVLPEDIQECAEALQSVCEDFCNSIEKSEAEK